MKAEQITEKTIQKAHCDWIKAQAEEIKALLQYNDNTIQENKQRALSGIETAIASLKELQVYINEI